MEQKSGKPAVEAPVRVAVIGVGSMGSNHLRVYDTLKNVDLVGIYDADMELAQCRAAEYGCHAFENLEDILKAVDAVSICTPSSTHCEVGLFFLNAGVHCLIEKPLAVTEEQCLDLIAAAKGSGAKLLVGHIERFNPAVRQLAKLLDGRASIQAIETHRLSAVSKRITDVDVVADLMVHDIDIVTSLARKKVVSVVAAGVKTFGSPGGDHVTTLLRFADESIACLTASRITQRTVRKLSVTTDTSLIDVDYMNQSVDIFLRDRVELPRADESKEREYAIDTVVERLHVRRREPLQTELDHFINVILTDGVPLVSGEDGLSALRLVWQIQDQVRNSRNADAE